MTGSVKHENILSIPVEVKEKKIEVKPFLLYVLVRTGVYRHEIAGVYPSEERAKEVAELLLEKELDDHHDYEIQPSKFNNVPELTNDPDGMDFIKELPTTTIFAKERLDPNLVENPPGTGRYIPKSLLPK